MSCECKCDDSTYRIRFGGDPGTAEGEKAGSKNQHRNGSTEVLLLAKATDLMQDFHHAEHSVIPWAIHH